ncbi:MAG: phage/plasmid primase, P4 family [Gammaproteobacteria bacterium]|nr:phage/plasmid primase, P4 family [Gammaproteobacteria bacterium]
MPTRTTRRHNGLILDRKDPMDAARRVVDTHFRVLGRRGLLHWDDAFHEYDDGRYLEASEADIRARLYAITDKALDPDNNPYRPNRSKVGDLMDAIKAVLNLPGTYQPPCWLAHDHPLSVYQAKEVMPVGNGLLHVPSARLYEPTPDYFTATALSIPFDEHAPEPRHWLAFLNGLWPNDTESIELLQMWFGYALTADTSQQKILLLIGPPRSGKGTIARVLGAMLGRDNVAGPTLSSLATNFGLEPLIGKILAIIDDARLGGMIESQVITERFLTISGEGSITVDRKYRAPFTGRLPTRFVIISNELPRLMDASGALASRFLVLQTTRSYLGNEDTGLTDRLLAELPGILLWAVRGYRMLLDRGSLTQPRSSMEAIQDLEDLASPITAFVRDECTQGPGESVAKHLLFDRWRIWCNDHGRRPGNLETFARDLRAAVPGLRSSRPRQGDGSRIYTFTGISLRQSSGGSDEY